ncbi:beta-N-acetylhexosaminidase [Vibrio vulnificus]|uniref:beta-N-acetylhexosaminidase n=1 Tax=Vibrio vulnificus TaxID=672 RepID=A0AAW4HBZ9_VIBVL|nr:MULTISPECIES: family 20 glycosylhydrolase [Vibrio]ASC57980.1 Beta-N-acetylhexosaminidase, (GlcNAc)2 catabolism [Vibrio vulnificus]ASM96831.1 beta-hexosaminidase [Vibrio vulnificus NBRC 15645 = ATCC 27562]AUL96575.1 Beta-N-acetylhexosaminidase, (GlcNAc)2 catabolism [Vibrio vulnificus]AVX00866.1 beta-hexosaminidase [Vibrio vulnificus Env1]EGQ7694646.1 beta-N-acetylhexosaminidase [Vibrio vulnificus]
MEYRIDLVVLSEQKQNCRFGMTLHNLSDQDLPNWSLTFAFTRFIQPGSISHGTLTQIGSFCQLTPDSLVLPANHHFYCEFTVLTNPFRFYSDGLNEAFVEYHHEGEQVRSNVDVTPIVLASPYRERETIAPTLASAYSLLPKANALHVDAGHFSLTPSSAITCQSALADSAVTWLMDEVARLHQFKLATSEAGEIVYRSNPTLDEGAYQLKISQEQVRVEAGSSSGFVHATASLLQLLDYNSITQEAQLACCSISDSPRFRYRGMMLDCSRHFHSVEQVKRLINLLAHYKFNTFHWHLTDDEGWRVEIKAFPALTEIGAWRGVDEAIEPQYTHISQRYGGFYSQEEIKEVVAYAAQRSIMVIPEIDVPGHCRAAIKSLPEMLVEVEDDTVYRSIQNYSDNVLNPGLSTTYQFLDGVLEEIAQLFPAPYVHIGADEVPHGVWSNSPSCQALMKQHGYQDYKELQGHLLRHAEQKLRSLGKRMLGWEEAQHGDKVSKDTVIYSWLSEDAAVNCARQGFDVVLQPAQTTYLDMTQDYAPEEPGVDWANPLPLEKAYNYEPLANIPADDPIHKRIWGIQTALWCEIINNPERMDYMVFPRIIALAEACWTQKEHRDWNDFLSRLKGHLPLLDKQGIKYRQPWK